jgi:predicted TIM-barrel fold metal-dependent hydrolase
MEVTTMAIDVHGHFTPIPFLRHLERRRDYPQAEHANGTYTVYAGPRNSYQLTDVAYDLERRCEALAALGFDRQIVSLSAPYGFDALHGSEAVDLAESVNAALREAAAIDPARYAVLAVAPVEEDGSGVAVLRRALDAGQRGIILSGSMLTHLASAEPLEPLLALLNERRAIVFVHPGSHPELAGVPPTRLGISGVAFQNELTAALLRLLDWGMVTRFADLRLLFCNLGGTVPFLIERWQHMGGEEILPLLDRISFDCSSFGPRGIELAVEALGEDRILLGTDYPVQPLERPLEALKRATLSLATREAILTKNAERLLGQDSGLRTEDSDG